ncbi:bifunctional methylenetetrahydrofolate dehydrogenase/methenyltetrahydrofolate cyclohydrolase FolD [Neisseriaceae bacterium PsAf]|nr:bifunctional methylenetetrahydrofolate dehydrogenase/methenyltetrahydrofolate cyclohydrolase FolD [Neisseriaceae bacterium PsAf]
MSAKLIDGKLVSEKLLTSVKKKCDARIDKGLRAPCLAVVLVGDDPASAVYVRNKKKACEKVGIRSLSYEKNSKFTEHELLSLVQELNENDEVDGILVQLPLPSHIDENKIIEKIHPQKDVDGFHPYNIGRLAIKRPLLRPCTPKGVMLMLEEYGIDVKGKNVTIVGQSNIVGRPIALEMLLKRATITICHTATKDLKAEVQRADIVVAGVGRPNLIKGDWIQEGAVVIDVGINRLENGKLCGDVEFEVAKERASYITPVPGGVGPMTIASLLDNTLIAAGLRDE